MTAQNEQRLEEATKQQWLELSGDEKTSREAGSATQRPGTRLQDATGLEGVWVKEGQIGYSQLHSIFFHSSEARSLIMTRTISVKTLK